MEIFLQTTFKIRLRGFLLASISLTFKKSRYNSTKPFHKLRCFYSKMNYKPDGSISGLTSSIEVFLEKVPQGPRPIYLAKATTRICKKCIVTQRLTFKID